MAMKFETAKFVGGSHHEREISIPRGVLVWNLRRHWTDPPPAGEAEKKPIMPERYERSVKHDGTVFMVYRPKQ